MGKKKCQNSLLDNKSAPNVLELQKSIVCVCMCLGIYMHHVHEQEPPEVRRGWKIP